MSTFPSNLKATPSANDPICIADSANGNNLAYTTMNAFIGSLSFLTASSTNTLTNKIMDGGNNTFTNIPLTSSITGVLPVLNGGTGVTTKTGTGNVVLSTSPTLVTPSFSSIVNTGTLTLPTSTDTLVGRNTVDALTNKTVNGVTLSTSAPVGTFSSWDGTYRTPSGGGNVSTTDSSSTVGNIVVEAGTGGTTTKDSGVAVTSIAIFSSGMMMPYAGSSAPTGWLICDGSAISRTTYSALFAVIGTTYGVGNGSTTFNVPPNGVVFVGYKSGDANFGALGATLGEATHTLTVPEIPSHSHNVPATTSGGSTPTAVYNTASNNQTLTTTSTGGGGAHNNIQPTLVINYIIKT